MMKTNTKKKFLSLLLALVMMLSLSACANDGSESQFEPPASSGENSASNSPAPTDTTPPTEKEETTTPSPSEATTPDTQPGEGEEIKIKITVGAQELTATLEDNATTQALLERLPLTIPMMDLYAREVVYRFDDPLPADEVQMRSYEVGEIIYWPPRHSFVFMYAQNGEQFSMQTIGRIDSGVEIFEETGDVEVIVELIEE